MASRTFRTAAVALAFGIAAISASSGSASAKPIFLPKGPIKLGMPGKFVKPYGYGWGPGLGLGLGLAAVGLAGAYAASEECHLRRVITIDGDVLYRKVCD